MTEAQFQEKLLDLRKELLKINGQIATKTTPENPGRVREVKKTIARIYTHMHQRDLQKKHVQPQKSDSKAEVVKKDIKEATKLHVKTSGGKTKKL